MIDKVIYSALDATKLSEEEKQQALRAINVIKEKQSGILKGRHCADGRPQRPLFDKSETSSPTASQDSFFLSLMIDMHEQRNVATVDIAGAYLNANMPGLVIVKLTGKDVSLMCNVSPEFKDKIAVENGQRVLYLKLDKALYGCVQSA